MQQQIENHALRSSINHLELKDRGIEEAPFQHTNIEERIKRLEDSKLFEMMGQITYWFRIRTDFNLSSIIGLICLGFYLFIFIDYFIFRRRF